MITWGLLAIGMLFVRTPAQFYTVRFLLGMSEAGFFPGVVFYLMQWFPPELRARTVSRFYISLPLSAAFMGLIAGALLNLDGQLGLAAGSGSSSSKACRPSFSASPSTSFSRTLPPTPNGSPKTSATGSSATSTRTRLHPVTAAGRTPPTNPSVTSSSTPACCCSASSKC